MSLHPRNAPCPCGSGVKYKRCCIGREAELARRADAAAELLALAAVFPLLRPSDQALETWAEPLEGAEVTREVVEAGIERAGERECERIAGWLAQHHPDIWTRIVADFGDPNEAGQVVVAGGVAQFLKEERSVDEEWLEHIDGCPNCSSDHAVALAGALECCDLWSVAEAATVEEVLSAAGEELDEQRFEAVVDATEAELWTNVHGPRLALLVERVRRRLPQPEWPQASEVLVGACARFERDDALRDRVASLLLADSLGPLGAVELGLGRAA